MIEFTMQINGMATPIGIAFQHLRSYRNNPVRSMSREEVAAQVKSDLASKGAASKTQVKKTLQKMYNGPENGSGTHCSIVDLSAATLVDGKRDFSNCKVFGESTAILSRSDTFRAEEGRRRSLTAAMNQTGWDPETRNQFWAQYWPNRRAEIARSLTADAVRRKAVSVDEKEDFYNQQLEKLSGCFKA